MEELRKALLVTTVSGFVPQFEMNNVRILQDMGYEVHYASNYNNPSYGNDNHRLDGTGIIRHQIDFVRSPFNVGNLAVYRQLCSLMRRERFALVHCHTPMGGVMARLAAHATHTGPVIYTAHGFHFFKGAPLINWLCYYPIERFLSRYTDQQICMNQEDYQRARKSFHAGRVDYIPGVGIDLSRVVKMDERRIADKKRELGLPEDSIVVLSAGELIRRKNHETALRALAKMDLPEIRYVICGHGVLENELKSLAQELGIAGRVLFLGYREDIMEIYPAADLFLFPSYQEGLPVALLEAQASGLPVVCADIRGNCDLMGEIARREDGLEFCSGGIMVKSADDADGFAHALEVLLGERERFREYGRENRIRSEQFSAEKVAAVMRRIYREINEAQ